MKNGKSRRVVLRHRVLAVAIGACLASSAFAESSDCDAPSSDTSESELPVVPSGSLFGRALPGSTVTIRSEKTGEIHTALAIEDGTYRLARVPVGEYQVTGFGEPGQVVASVRSNVRISAGIGTPVSFAGSIELSPIHDGTFAAAVEIDVTEPASIFTTRGRQLREIPLRRDIADVALLAPGTVRGDSAFGNLGSFGGSSVAENRYSFNGFNITNPLNGLGFTQVPFEGIAEHQVMSGGWGAQYGGATGGVVNLSSRRGTNDFHAGASFYWSPQSLNETDPDLFDGYGNRLANHSKDNGWNYTANLWASGALVQDRLFAYALVSSSESQANAGASSEATSEQPNWLVKLDWNINDDHLLEFTALSDKRDVDTDYYATSYNDDLLPSRDAFLGSAHQRLGGETYILKYSAYLTDNFVLSALAGTSQSAHGNFTTSASGISGESGNGCPIIIDARTSVGSPVVGCSVSSFVGRSDAEEQRDQFRVKGEWQLDAHQLTGGLDWDRSSAVSGQSYSGGTSWRYSDYSGDSYLALRSIYTSGGEGEQKQTSAFIQDDWQLTDDLVAQLGLRWERYDYRNPVGSMLDSKGEWQPRLGFAWDVNGDSSLKVFGTAGRYSMPLPAGVVALAAGSAVISQDYFTFTSVDPVTGAPTDPVPLFGTVPGDGPVGAKDPSTIASSNLKAISQDEYILGVQKMLGDHISVGVRGIYRDLKRAVDDTCDYRPVIQWALDHGFTGDGGIFISPADRTQESDIAVYNPGFSFCRLLNPGSDAAFRMDINGDGQFETVEIGADDVWQADNIFGMSAGTAMLPVKARRDYRAIEVFFEGVWDRLWMQGSYTLARSRGNTEVGVRSDTGQADVFRTVDFDYPELASGSYGYLPNDRRHTIKLFGSYAINDQWLLGGNLLVQSGRPFSCLGYLGNIQTSTGNEYFSCDLNSDVTGGHDNGSTIVPRGSAGRTPRMYSLDLNARYMPAFADGDLTFQIDVFNVFNRHTAIAVNEYGEDRNGNPQGGGNYDSGEPRPFLYAQATDWQAPRSIRLSARYEF